MIQAHSHRFCSRLVQLSTVGLALASGASGSSQARTARHSPTAAKLSYRVLVLDPIPFADTSKTPEGEARMFQPIAARGADVHAAVSDVHAAADDHGVEKRGAE